VKLRKPGRRRREFFPTLETNRINPPVSSEKKGTGQRGTKLEREWVGKPGGVYKTNIFSKSREDEGDPEKKEP